MKVILLTMLDKQIDILIPEILIVGIEANPLLPKPNIGLNKAPLAVRHPIRPVLYTLLRKQKETENYRLELAQFLFLCVAPRIFHYRLLIRRILDYFLQNWQHLYLASLYETLISFLKAVLQVLNNK